MLGKDKGLGGWYCHGEGVIPLPRPWVDVLWGAGKFGGGWDGMRVQSIGAAFFLNQDEEKMLKI